MNDLDFPPELSPEPIQPAAKRKDGFWQRLAKRRFLLISILIHVVFAVLATLFVVQRFSAHKITFTSAPPSNDASKHALDHPVQMAKKQTTSAPLLAQRIVSTGLSKITLPEMPTMPATDDFTPSKMAGMGGTAMGLGLVSSGGGGGGGGGGGVPFFGLRDSGDGTLEGTFYDFKRKETGENNGFQLNDFKQLLKTYSTSGNIPNVSHYFVAKTKLYSKYFLFPAIKDTEAPAAFQSPESGPGSWIAVYRGNITMPDDGSYRFVGFGDNVMFVRTNGRLLLDASDLGYSGRQRTGGGNVSFPAKNSTPIFFGSWFEARKGEIRPIEIAVGDEGGIFCAGLFIQKQGDKYQQGANGIPQLPLFTAGPLTDDEKKGLEKYLPADSLNGPVFQARSAPAKSIFNSALPNFP
jgi:hypothetical protein